MPIELTDHQQWTLEHMNEQPPRVLDPRTKMEYVLLLAQDYESVRQTIEEEQRQQAVFALARKNAVLRETEDP